MELIKMYLILNWLSKNKLMKMMKKYVNLGGWSLLIGNNLLLLSRKAEDLYIGIKNIMDGSLAMKTHYICFKY